MRIPATLARTAIAASVAAVALAVHSPGDAPVSARTVSSSGAIQHANSRNGQAVLSASGMRPGASTSGTVTITNSGNGAGAFALEASGLSDTPGPTGGRLASALTLSVRDEGSSQIVYSGPLDGLTTRTLGTWAAGESRTYRFDVSLPSAPGGQNSLQASRARASFRWTAQAADAPPTGGQDPAPPATGDPVPPSSGTGSGGSGGLVTPPPARDTKPPKLTLRAAKTQKVRRGSVKLTATCDEDCRIVAASLRGAKWKAPKLLKARKKTKVTIKLSKKDAKKLRKRRKAVIKLKLTAADMAANRATAKVKIAVKR